MNRLRRTDKQTEKTPGSAGSSTVSDAQETTIDMGDAPVPPRIARIDLLTPGRQYGPYEIKKMLGRGGMGEVYEAVHAESGHRVALKLVSARGRWSERQRRRFLREGTLAASLNHPNSLYVYGTEEIDGTPVIAMELANGGTLKEIVEADGPLPVAQAVHAAMQIADGLRAAAELGILHRDVKPGNCFLHQSGSVKIGDFGLAISSSPAEETALTATGAFIGTPAFASPEQIRGRDLDLRSDIYSLGATLYYLLTGRTPHEGLSGASLVAAILEQTPAAPDRLRPEIPRGLSRVVLRCLAKDPSARFQTYEDLKRALFAHGPQSLIQAPLSRRAAAGLVDGLLAGLLLTPALLLLPEAPEASIPLVVVSFLVQVLYGGIGEGVWGATPAKALLGLRVVSGSGQIPGIRRAIRRSLIFYSVPMVLYIVGLLWSKLGSAGAHSAVGSAIAQLSGIAVLLPFLPAWRSHGSPGLHDRWSNTRVVLKPRLSLWRLQPKLSLVEESPDSGERIGPYSVATSCDSLRAGEVIAGFDRTLRRNVWIRILESGTPALTDGRRTVSRQGRLRWLNGRRTAGVCWDAFEAIDGKPFLEVIQRRPEWAEIRAWLLDLAEEAANLSPEEFGAGTLSLDHLWITGDGHAVLLDFPAPFTTRSLKSDWPLKSDLSDPGGPTDFQTPAGFLAEVAQTALFPPLTENGESPRAAFRPLPVHARELLLRWQGDGTIPAADMVADLRACLTNPAAFGRRRRLAQLALAAWIPLLSTAVVLVMSTWTWFLRDRGNPDAVLFNKAYEELDRTKDRMGPLSEGRTQREEALKILIAGPWRHVADDSVGTSSGKKPIVDDAGPGSLLSRILEQHPAPTDQEIRGAQETLKGFLFENRHAGTSRQVLEEIIPPVLAVPWIVLMLSAPPLLLLGCIFRGGLTYPLLGLAVVRIDGKPASRVRCLARSLVGWSPVLLFWIFVLHDGFRSNGNLGYRVGESFGASTRGHPAFWIVAVCLFVAGVVWAIARPGRSLPDRIMGTCIVPL